MTVLLSIKPEFADKIFDGTKKYEFRRRIFKKEGVKKVIVYVTSPVQKIIGEFLIESIIYEDTLALWKKTKEFAGISKEAFDIYFADQYQAYAIKIGKYKKYRHPKLLADYKIMFPPQSFVYV